MSLRDILIQKVSAATPTPTGQLNLQFPTGKLSTAPGAGVQALGDRILQILVDLAYPLAIICIIYTAYILISSSNSPDGYTKAKKNITYLIIGVFLIIFASVFVNIAIGFFK